MHEALLFTQVPETRHSFVLKTLAGFCAMQPQPILERRLIYKPTRDPTTVVVTKKVVAPGAQTTLLSRDLFYLQLKGDLSGRKTLDIEIETPHNPENETDNYSWSLEFCDLPEPIGTRPAMLRQVASIPVTAGSPREMLSAMGYQ